MKSWELFKGTMQEILSQPLLFYSKFGLFIFFNWNKYQLWKKLWSCANAFTIRKFFSRKPGRRTWPFDSLWGRTTVPGKRQCHLSDEGPLTCFFTIHAWFYPRFLSMSQRDVISRRRAFWYFPPFNTNPLIIFLVCFDAEEFFFFCLDRGKKTSNQPFLKDEGMLLLQSDVGCAAPHIGNFFFFSNQWIISHHIKNLFLRPNAEKFRQRNLPFILLCRTRKLKNKRPNQ